MRELVSRSTTKETGSPPTSKCEIDWGTPSSVTWKSLPARLVTIWPLESRTVTGVLTRVTRLMILSREPSGGCWMVTPGAGVCGPSDAWPKAAAEHARTTTEVRTSRFAEGGMEFLGAAEQPILTFRATPSLKASSPDCTQFDAESPSGVAEAPRPSYNGKLRLTEARRCPTIILDRSRSTRPKSHIATSHSWKARPRGRCAFWRNT